MQVGSTMVNQLFSNEYNKRNEYHTANLMDNGTQSVY